MLTIKKIIYNPPATIVFWSDGTKTTARCEYGDIYTREVGFMLCVLKKKYGNKTFHEMLKKYVYGVPDKPNEKGMVIWENKPPKKRVTLKKPTENYFEVKTFNNLEDYITYVMNNVFTSEDE